jgi:NAD(P)H-dependent FMN reductase
MTVRIAGIAGSLRRESFNRSLMHAVAHEMPPGAELTLWDGLGVPVQRRSRACFISGVGATR